MQGLSVICKLDAAASTPTTFAFISREIESNPGNWRARHTTEKYQPMSSRKFSRLQKMERILNRC
jgi:hypothetical protein